MRIKWYHVTFFAVCVLLAAWVVLPSERTRGLQLLSGPDVRKAETYLARTLKRNPQDKAARLGLVEVKIREGDEAGVAALLADLPMTDDLRARLADFYEQRGDADKAIAMLTPALKGDESDLPVWKRLARLEEARANPQAQAKNLEHAVALKSELDTWTQLLSLYLLLGDSAGAARAATAVESFPDAPIDTLRLVRLVRVRALDAEGMMRVAERICSMPARTLDDWQVRADFAAWTGGSKSAVAALNAALGQYPGDLSLLRKLMAATDKSEYAAQRAEWAASIAQKTNSQADWREAAFAQADAGHAEQGWRMLKPLVESGRAEPATTYACGQLAFQAGARGETRTCAKVLAGGEAQSAIWAADLFTMLGDSDNALLALESAVRAYPNDPVVLGDLAQAYIDAGHPEKALQVTARLAALPDADPVRVRRLRARSYLVADSKGVLPVAAREDMLRAVEASLADDLDPDMAASLASTYLAMGRMNDALRIRERLKPPPAALDVEFARTYVDRGDQAAARKMLDSLGEAGRLTAQDLPTVAALYESLGEHRRAIDLYSRALETSPADDSIALGLAEAYGNAGNKPKQYELMRARALKGKAREWLDAANCCLSAKDRASEERMLSEGLRYYPDSPILLARQVLALTALRRTREAEESRNRLRAASKADTAESARSVAEAWEMLGNSDEAVQAQERFLTFAPDTAEARLSLARLRAQRQEYNRAVAEYGRYLKQKPDDGLVWFELAEFQRQKGGNGVEAYSQAERLLKGSDDPWVISLCARIKERLGRFEESKQLWKEAAAKDASLENSSDYVQFLIGNDMLAQAEQVVASAGGAQSRNSAVRHGAAQVMLMYDQNLAAEPLLQEVRRARPDDIGVVADLARAQDANGYWWKSLREYDDMARRSSRR